jgi:putative glutamine amidotransferase
VLGQTETDVNSFHHQSVDTLGDGLVVSARAPDGTVEGLEGLDGRFVVGVQWHAECLVERSEHAALFAAFVEAARRSGEAHASLARVA